MAGAVAAAAAAAQLLDDGVVGDLVVGFVVVLDEIGGAALDAALVACTYHSLLAGGGDALAA